MLTPRETDTNRQGFCLKKIIGKYMEYKQYTGLRSLVNKIKKRDRLLMRI